MPGQARTCKNLYKMSQVPDCKPCHTYILANLTLGSIKADKVFFSYKGWGQSAKLKKQSRIWGKFGTAIQGYILNPCTKFPPNPTSRKVNNQELTSQHHA